MAENESLFKQVLTWTVVGILALLAIKFVLGLVGMAFGLVTFLLFTVGPILLVGYVVTRLLGHRRKRLSKAEREWLER